MTPLWTTSQLCELLAISPATLSRMIRANKIPYVMLNKTGSKMTVRFKPAEIERWLERRSRGAVPAKVAEIQQQANG